MGDVEVFNDFDTMANGWRVPHHMPQRSVIELGLENI